MASPFCHCRGKGPQVDCPAGVHDVDLPKITDVLGRTRTASAVFPGGEWNCPFCTAAVNPAQPCRGYAAGCAHPAHCPNPACFANPHYPVEHARKVLADAQAREREERARESRMAEAVKRAQEDREARAAATESLRQVAIKLGACVRCALHPSNYKKKLVKHRGQCPRDGRR